MKETNINELKEKLKKGTISYFSITEEERFEIEKLLKQEIEDNKKETEIIKDKIREEKNKFKK